MKKFISMVLTAAMVVSLVPATAFAKNDAVTATAKVVNAAELSKGETAVAGPELQLKVTGTQYTAANPDYAQEITVTLDNAEFTAAPAVYVNGDVVVDAAKLEDKDEATVTLDQELAKDDVIAIALDSEMTKKSVGAKAAVSVDSDMVTTDDALVYATIMDAGLKVSVKKVAEVAEEEIVALKKITVEPTVGDFKEGQVLELKLSKGFEFVDDADAEYVVTAEDVAAGEVVFEGIEVEADTAKAGAVATLTVKTKHWDSASVEVAKVVDYVVTMSVDEDEDVPEMYSGVNAAEEGLTSELSHDALEVTIKESYKGAWSAKKGFTFELPEGVYVTDVAVDADNFADDVDWDAAFEDAYQEGDHVTFEFAKRLFSDNYDNENGKPAELNFTLTLVADPDFEGDVDLKFSSATVEEQEVTIAKFMKPYTVEAQQNDVVIDYRYTKVPTAIVVKEAEAGLWAEGAEFDFAVERGDMIQFENDATFEVNEESEMELKDEVTGDGVLAFTVDAESEEAAVVTIKDMELFLQRNVPAGPYDLSLNTSLADAYNAAGIYAPDAKTVKDPVVVVGDVADYDDVVKEAFVNVITAGRDQDDASFTTKVVVPVGADKIVAGGKEIALDVPAYISAAGYTMLPIRAVATALGIDNNNVLWNQPTKTVTIFYGQRIITMVAGQKTVTVNGNVIPASAAVEIVNNRTFLPMRDLAHALGVTDITWDAATKTATLNGGVVAE